MLTAAEKIKTYPLRIRDCGAADYRQVLRLQHQLTEKRRRDEIPNTILIVEHNMQILDLCDRVVVISFGQKITEGLPKEVRANEKVIKAYFGDEHAT